MKLIKTMAITAGVFLAPLSALAATTILPLGQIVVQPNSQAPIPLTALQPNIAYNVNCTLNTGDLFDKAPVVGFGTTYVSGSNGYFIFNE